MDGSDSSLCNLKLLASSKVSSKAIVQSVK